MRNILFLLCSFMLLLSPCAYARPHYGGGDTDSSRLKSKKQPVVATQTMRSFPELDKYLQQNGVNQ
jgi:hypothetical protein